MDTSEAIALECRVSFSQEENLKNISGWTEESPNCLSGASESELPGTLNSTVSPTKISMISISESSDGLSPKSKENELWREDIGNEECLQEHRKGKCVKSSELCSGSHILRVKSTKDSQLKLDPGVSKLPDKDCSCEFSEIDPQSASLLKEPVKAVRSKLKDGALGFLGSNSVTPGGFHKDLSCRGVFGDPLLKGVSFDMSSGATHREIAGSSKSTALFPNNSVLMGNPSEISRQSSPLKSKSLVPGSQRDLCGSGSVKGAPVIERGELPLSKLNLKGSSGKGVSTKSSSVGPGHGDRGFITPRSKDLYLVHSLLNLGLSKSRSPDFTCKTDQHEKVRNAMLKVSKSMIENLASKSAIFEDDSDKGRFSDTGSKDGNSSGTKGDEGVEIGCKRKLPPWVAEVREKMGYDEGEKRSKGDRVYPKTLIEILENWSSEKPDTSLGDVDILEVAMRAGLTFPVPAWRKAKEP
ncbi:uncharacterized protein LOC18446492 [Amborella trichopoda]|uniref:Uncharacterized protein n=1 Tax=Amborella trichopoda TaxID=13333 RepID=U5DCL3_AMBTC|nr:uncharacterized protein LOC18446492 [Amborella trichopoda]ERN18138.1 hypothetical protein AMTR_s00054p00079690 [Amborella trichopoda]|eukprot:XP_006856671.1 uncharacterized protein LOC18446492 [Amborella trichopoda]